MLKLSYMDIQISELIDSTARLAPKDFEMFIQGVYLKRASQRSPALLVEELALLNKIYIKFPAESQKRLVQLKNKLSEHTLTEAEHSEYMGLIELKENHNAACVENIVALAQSRGVPPKELMKQLGIFPLSK